MSDVRGLVLDCMTLISAKGCWLDNFSLTEGILYRRVSEVKGFGESSQAQKAE